MEDEEDVDFLDAEDDSDYQEEDEYEEEDDLEDEWMPSKLKKNRSFSSNRSRSTGGSRRRLTMDQDMGTPVGLDTNYKQETKVVRTKLEWCQGVTYACTYCPQTYLHAQMLKGHLFRIHGYNERFRKYNYLQEKVDLECQVCHIVLLRDEAVISTHVRKTHRMSLLMYEQKYHSRDKEQR